MLFIRGLTGENMSRARRILSQFMKFSQGFCRGGGGVEEGGKIEHDGWRAGIYASRVLRSQPLRSDPLSGVNYTKRDPVC